VNTVKSEDFSRSVMQRPSLLTAENIAVIYNSDDPKSVEVANYYAKARHVPRENLIAVKLPVEGSGIIDLGTFNKLKATIDKQLTDRIQVQLLVWKTPFSVLCNSITSAFTLGFDPSLCQDGCGVGTKNPYFNSRSLMPYNDLKIRPTMLLPTDNVDIAKAVIDRGVLSEFTLNDGTGYFLRTSDKDRSLPRERFYPKDFGTIKSKHLILRSPKSEFIQDKKDVMFYFTGKAEVQKLDTLTFLPGAIADHLTSAGGILDRQWQMQITEWLRAGATGSYGAVTEPCNYWQKFPNPQVVLSHYLAGETLIEAYWKSVMWPAQGLFIGEPLAAPYKFIDTSVFKDANNTETPQ
jgi:uncharacterized protein (TIGR03790 family)